MGLLKAWGKNLAYPYIYLGRTIKTSAKNVTGQLSSARKGIGRLREEAARVNAMEDEGGVKGRAAFQEKVEAVGWTKEALEKRRLSVARSKWLCRFFTVLTGTLGIVCFFAYPGFWGSVSGIALLFVMALYIVRTFIASLYLTQLEEKSLFTAKQFFSRPDVFSRVFLK